ncbi:MAG: histidine--tRNA ligase [Candidatus Paracaedimonas acanthamoebae]|uniref:Histidine--tRNA ligase n=1 Tax=Candidatus Paracaedimonas acanthamoebae TaxID=244581 RepID=A0A8J7PM61_9PROT|nr:histidine--tRNA ligase [Candidatus Paracaedimonas acanthamoebae]
MFQPVRGTHDLLPNECRQYRFIVKEAMKVAGYYGFDEISTPIFEFSGVFHRLGETSDIVSKETYTFKDRGGEELTLRPEGTAGVVRAVISNGMAQHAPLKLSYAGPMFRYERPQRGRYRQFDQIGVELIGTAIPTADIEVIAMAYHILKTLGIEHKIKLEINTLGDPESRETYKKALLAYLMPLRAKLSPESQDRLERNPLRILDSKTEQDKEIIKEAPVYGDYLNEASKIFFKEVCRGLELLEIPYKINPRLVRGLDYYCHTTFEFITDALGAQSAVIAGGRYDNLVEMMGGPHLPGIGWGAGVDRISLLKPEFPKIVAPVAMIPLGEQAEEVCLKLAQELRYKGIFVDMGYHGNLSKRLKRADKVNATHAVIIGEDEIRTEEALVRDFKTGVQEKISFTKLIDKLIKE